MKTGKLNQVVGYTGCSENFCWSFVIKPDGISNPIPALRNSHGTIAGIRNESGGSMNCSACFKVVVDVPPVVSLEEMAENQKMHCYLCRCQHIVKVVFNSSSPTAGKES